MHHTSFPITDHLTPHFIHHQHFIHHCQSPHPPLPITSSTTTNHLIHHHQSPHPPPPITSSTTANHLIHHCQSPHPPLPITSSTTANHLIHHCQSPHYLESHIYLPPYIHLPPQILHLSPHIHLPPTTITHRFVHHTQRGNDMPPCRFHVSFHISATYCAEFRTQRFGSMQKQYATTKNSCIVSQLLIVAYRSQNKRGRGRFMEERGEG